MTATGRRAPLRTLDASELEAQRVACSYLVKGCERALFHFGLVAGETGNIEAAHVDQRAADIMRLVLTSWRDTLSLLPPGSAQDKSRKTADSWMVMQIPGEQGPVLKRREH
ncbi:MAG TPA: hypothetical protein VJL07_00590 [Dehalococcoidia bacterium]|nr:hypothetical protein [Dehalococcoidia bacterium]